MLTPDRRVAAPHVFGFVPFVINALQFCAFLMDADPELLIFDGEHEFILGQFTAFNAYIRVMFRNLAIVWTSFKMALQEFRSNKLRTFLSLLGITFGIFCIISVLSTISSMQQAVNNDKWQYSGGPDFPWWKYIKRPVPKIEEAKLLRLKVPDAEHIDFEIDNSG